MAKGMALVRKNICCEEDKVQRLVKTLELTVNRTRSRR